MEGAGILSLSPLLPFLAAVLLPFLRLTGKNQKLLYSLVVVIGTFILSLYLAWRCQGQTLVLFWITENIPILLRMDGVSVIYLVLASLLWIGTVIYSHEYIDSDQYENRYYAFLYAVLGSLMGIGLSGNIVTFYLFFELMAFMVFPLICHDGKEVSMKGAIIFIMYSIFGAALVLIGIAMLYGLGDLSTFQAGGLGVQIVSGREGQIATALLLMIFGFGCKAGMYPLQAWLPIAHPIAPAPISAALSALVTKTGVLGIIRTVFYMVDLSFLKDTWIQYLWLTMALLTIFIGSCMAFREPLLKKRLAYSSVSQLSYILFGLAILSPVGFTGAFMHFVYHAFAKLILFLCAGAIIHQTQLQYVGELKGIGKKMPVVMWCFTLSSLSLIGIPPMGGFFSKWHLISAALRADIGIFSWLGPVVLLISAFLTAGYLLPIIIAAFFPGDDFDYANNSKLDPGWKMTGPLTVLAGLAILQGLFPKGFISHIITIANELMRGV